MDLSDSFVQPLAEFVERHQVWAGAVVGGLAFLESLVLIGAFIPATALMLACGGLIAAGILDPWSTIAFCVIGAVAGDAVSFYVGQRLAGKKLHPNLVRFRRQVARARFYTRRYGALTIFAGRFFGPLRAFVPTVAGMLKMNPRTFQIANVTSALVWAPVMLAPGYLASWASPLLRRRKIACWRPSRSARRFSSLRAASAISSGSAWSSARAWAWRARKGLAHAACCASIH